MGRLKVSFKHGLQESLPGKGLEQVSLPKKLTLRKRLAGRASGR